MSKTVGIPKKNFLVTVAWLLTGGTALLAQPVAQQAEPGVIDCRQMRPGQFEKLPDAQRIRCGDEEKTAGELRSELQIRRQSLQEQARQAGAEAQAKLQELQGKYGPKISLEEAQARMQTELSRLKRQIDDRLAEKDQLAAIRQEAAQLFRQMQTAQESQDTKKIQKRANELLDQLRRMGKPPPDTQKENPVFMVCEVTDCWNGTLYGVPKITGVLPFSIISPEGPIIIKGEHFGTVEGTLWLKGSFGTLKMAIDSWSSGGIGAFFPSATDIGPISDLSLSLQVETSIGLMSNEKPLQWVQEVKLLDTDLVNVYECGQDANVNSCNWQLHTGSQCFSFSHMAEMILNSKPPDPACPCTAVGFHGNCWGAVGDDSGTDGYIIGPLKNGWTLLSIEFEDSLSKVDSCDDAVPPSGFSSGGNLWFPAVSWCVTPNDELFYWLWVYIVGPKGFPHM